MIRINLIDGQRGRQSRRGGGGGAGSPRFGGPGLLWGGGMILAAVLILGSHYTLIQLQAHHLARGLAAAQQENQRLQAVQRDYDELQRRQKDLMSRIAVIQQLGQSQVNPTDLMLALGQTAIAGPNLWLTGVEAKNAALEVRGEATSLTRVADFMTALQQSGRFSEVEIQEGKANPGTGNEGPYSFRLLAQIRPSDGPKTE